MIKKTILLTTAVIFLSGLLNAQIININPDKNAEPWIVGGLRVPSKAEIDKIPLKSLFENKFKDILPASLDNTSQPYFRPIFSQTDGCCAQASGIAYNFTYEMNYIRNTSANTAANRYPTHYTYNYLNGGSGSNGSWYTDGWNIIASNGCPTEEQYGGLVHSNAQYWQSEYSDYENGMGNKVVDYFAIDVSTPEGLETLKYWMYNHLDSSPAGGIVNFAAGVSDVFDMTYDDIIIEWGHSVNHAMTFVGWDDNIEYDFNGDDNITNDVDINDDGVVDMRDWERGALIMVNSWGVLWGNGGKAYVMYKLLAEPVDNGGIHANRVFSVNVRETYSPKLIMRVKMEHDVRNMIKVSAGVSVNLSSSVPEFEMGFPLFNKQGGQYDMDGSTSNPIEFSLDITPLLSYVNSGETSKFFLKIDENDTYGFGSGQIYDFSIYDVENSTEYTSSSHNVSIINNSSTLLSVNSNIVFDSPEITTLIIPDAIRNQSFNYLLEASGGTSPYKWSIKLTYPEESLSETFPVISANQLIPSDNDDGYVLQNLDFEFPFYGKRYNSVVVSTDGSLIFEETFSYLRNESAIISNKMIAVFASDLMIYPADGDGLFYEGDQNGATFRWKTSLYGQESANIDVALRIFPSGEMKYYYRSGITEGLDWASGISNGDNMNYTISSVSGISNPSNMQLKFSAPDFPAGTELNEEGIFSGTPENTGTWNIDFVVTDFDKISKIKSLNFTVSPASNVENIADNSLINCFPNPVSDILEINYYSNKKENTKIEFIDITGKDIIIFYSGITEKGENKFYLNVKDVSKGIYFLKLTTSEQVYTEKIIIR